MRVSLIIPTRNGGQSLRELFLALQKQSVKPDQILVVDSLSNDDTLDICRDFEAEVIQIEAIDFDHGGTRNLAVTKAMGQILVFMTQDAFFKDTECLKNLIEPLEEPSIAASFGRQVPKKDANPVEIFAKSFNYPPMSMIKGIDDLPKLG